MEDKDKTAQEALAHLIQAVEFAQRRGVYGIADSEIISKAIKVFIKKDEPQEEKAKSPEPEQGA